MVAVLSPLASPGAPEPVEWGKAHQTGVGRLQGRGVLRDEGWRSFSSLLQDPSCHSLPARLAARQ